MITKTKTIKMLLYDGTLNGVTNISDSAWEIGKMYSAPRDSISDLVKKADCRKYGVYLLLSELQVYVGQASDLERRTKQHLSDKKWWTQIVLMTTKDDSFNASDIDYLESMLIDLATKAGTLDSDNKKQGNPKKVDEFRQAELEQYLDEAIFLLELIGVHVFKEKRAKHNKKNNRTIDIKPLTDCGNVGIKPALPDYSLGPCVFVKTAFERLLESGFSFSEKQITLFGSVEGSRDYTKRNLPLFWILQGGETRATCDKKIRERYWKKEYIIGQYRILLFSQWYDDYKKGATKEEFIKWYELL